jgi:hypothetical protein
MAIDDQLCMRIEAVLRKYVAEPDFESRIVSHVDRLAHLAKLAMCVDFDLPPRASRKVGHRGPSRARNPDKPRQPFGQAHQFFMDALCSTYSDLTGKVPTRSTKRGKFGAFAADIHKATQMEICLAYAVQRACEKYTQRRFIFSSQ